MDTDITFIILRWIVIFTTTFLLSFSITMIVGFFVMSWKEKKFNKQLMNEILKHRK